MPPQVGHVIFPMALHFGHYLPLTFLFPLQIGHSIVLLPWQVEQDICHRTFHVRNPYSPGSCRTHPLRLW